MFGEYRALAEDPRARGSAQPLTMTPTARSTSHYPQVENPSARTRTGDRFPRSAGEPAPSDRPAPTLPGRVVLLAKRRACRRPAPSPRLERALLPLPIVAD